MNDQIRNKLGKVAIVGILALAIAVFWFAASYANSVEPDSSFSVSAEGKVVAVPDIAQVSIEVVTEGGTNLGALQSDNTEKMNSVIDYIKEQGVDEEDIKTSSYNINPRYRYYDCSRNGNICPPADIVGYNVKQSVTVKIRDFSTIGTILSGVVDNGANSVTGMSFTLDDPTEVRDEARKIAIEKAQEKAESIADEAGFKIGKLLSLNESFSSPYNSYRQETLGMGGAADASITPSIEPGSQDITVNVHLNYEIK